MSMFQISFPGLGIGEFTLDRVAFSIGSLSVRWYGIVITVGILVAFLYAYYRTRAEKLLVDDLLDIGIFVVISGVVGARLYYVISSASSGRDVYRDFLDVIAVWNGGLAIYGGIIGGAIALIAVCLYKKIRILKLFDAITPGVMIAQAIGRWGNFFNGEAHGGIVADSSPLYFLRMGLYEDGILSYFHPTFFYESVWNVIGFVLINLLFKRKKFDGQVALIYFGWYGIGRAWIEGMRTDSLYFGHTDIRVSQVLGIACFVVSVGLMIAGMILANRGKLGIGTCAYYPNAKAWSKVFPAAEPTTPAAEPAESTGYPTAETPSEQEEERHGTEN